MSKANVGVDEGKLLMISSNTDHGIQQLFVREQGRCV